MSDSNSLKLYDESAIGLVTTDEITEAIAILGATLPDGAKMSRGQLGAIAQHSILTGTLPGTDVHYFVNRDKKLLKVDDYKLLVRWANEREQQLSGDLGTTIKDQYHTLTADEKATEGIADGAAAVYCIILTDRDQASVKGWIDSGIPPLDALNLVGTKAVGVVKAADKNIPVGWSPAQKARKLALKAAIRLRYGQPSVDELQAMRRRWASLATDEDWQQVPTDLPPDAQARYAQLVATGRESQEGSEGMTVDEHKERVAKNTALLHGPDDEVGIGDEKPADYDYVNFCYRVIEEIPFYRSGSDIETALDDMEFTYDPENEEFLFESLDSYAQSMADGAADDAPAQAPQEVE